MSRHDRLAQCAIALPRPLKRLLALLHDALLCALALWASLSLRLEHALAPAELLAWPYLAPLLAALAIALPLFVVNGLYRAVFRYSGYNALAALVRAGAVYTALYAALFTGLGLPGVPRSVGVFQPLLLLALMALNRALLRRWLGAPYRRLLNLSERPRVLIFGAGSAGRQLAGAIHSSGEQQLLGFVDDDPQLQGQRIDGWPVHASAKLPDLVAAKRVTDLLVAAPSMPAQRRKALLDQLLDLHLHVRTLPAIADLVNGRVTLADVKELEIEDLLGRDPVPPDEALIDRDTRAKVVLVTGAGGSIGSELCRQVLRRAPAKLLLLERTEFALYQIHQELQAELASNGGGVELIPLLASVDNPGRIEEIVAAWLPDTIYHAAAYKHVPLVEHNPAEGLRNNVWGTWVCAAAAARHGVPKFVLVSTDKAVRPTNVMGASKRLSELVLQAMQDAQSSPGAEPLDPPGWTETPLKPGTRTCFSMVRFGNVLGSSGSVVPLFRQQIKAGGPVTLTHADITRYFMTIPEAAQLVLQAGAMAVGGDVFVLDMGEPVRIHDLARRMIELSGLSLRDEVNPDGDIEIRVTGLRPGEKLYEELLIGNDPAPTDHPGIMKAHEAFLPWHELQRKLDTLDLLLKLNDVPAMKALLNQLVTDYSPHAEVVDWVHLEQDA